MDGDIAKMNEICDLADKYEVMVMTDECHSVLLVWQRSPRISQCLY